MANAILIAILALMVCVVSIWLWLIWYMTISARPPKPSITQAEEPSEDIRAKELETMLSFNPFKTGSDE